LHPQYHPPNLPAYNYPKSIVSRLAIPSSFPVDRDHWRERNALRDILDKDVPRQEPRRPFGRAIVNKASLSILSLLSFNRLPHNGLDGDTRIGHVGSAQNLERPDFGIPRRLFHSFISKSHPDLASSASHVDDAQESLRALQESADAFPNPHLKSAVSGVSALLQTAKVEQHVGFLQRCMFYQIL
jgi:hypothetical protein